MFHEEIGAGDRICSRDKAVENNGSSRQKHDEEDDDVGFCSVQSLHPPLTLSPRLKPMRKIDGPDRIVSGSG